MADACRQVPGPEDSSTKLRGLHSLGHANAHCSAAEPESGLPPARGQCDSILDIGRQPDGDGEGQATSPEDEINLSIPSRGDVCIEDSPSKKPSTSEAVVNDSAGAIMLHGATEQQKRDLQRQLHPRTRSDFAYLHDQVRLWMERETAAVKARNLPDSERTAALLRICHKESRYLQTINARQQNIAEAGKSQADLRHVKAAAEPALWHLPSGAFAHVVTPAIARAQKVAEVYIQLSAKFDTSAARMDALLEARQVLAADVSLSGPLELVNREIDMLNRGRKSAALGPLRARLMNALSFASSTVNQPELI